MMPSRERPLFNGDDIRAQLKSYDRSPFIDILALYLECTPTVEALVDFADAHPDRWATAIGVIGKLSGFTEKKEIAVDVNVNIRALSDSQLEDKLKELMSITAVAVSERSEEPRSMKVIEHVPDDPNPSPRDGKASDDKER